jgi:hypothetical protein
MFPIRPIEVFAFLALAVLAAFCLAEDAAAPVADDGFQVVVPDARTCAALAVYESKAQDWFLRAMIARASLNASNAGMPDPHCDQGLRRAIAGPLDTFDWQTALDAVDVVESGDYAIAPEACLNVTRAIPLDRPNLSSADVSEAAAAKCVVGNTAFAGGDL